MLSRSGKVIEDKDEDLVLQFCTTVLGLKSLHWGFWKEGEELSIDNLRVAQGRFSEVLRNHVPSGVKSILDIGCGIGDNARYLSSQGFSMTCISPDLQHKKAFALMKDESIIFHHKSIELFKTEKVFDAVLMSESAHYFDTDLAFEKFETMVKEKGFVIVAGLFRKKKSSEYSYFPIEKEWVACAKKHGFTVLEHNDITARVLPTSVLGGKLLEENLKPGISILGKYIKKRSPFEFFMLRLIFKKQMRELESYFRIGPIPEMFNAALFQKKARYSIYVLQKS